jgi:hypothetical protein
MYEHWLKDQVSRNGDKEEKFVSPKSVSEIKDNIDREKERLDAIIDTVMKFELETNSKIKRVENDVEKFESDIRDIVRDFKAKDVKRRLLRLKYATMGEKPSAKTLNVLVPETVELRRDDNSYTLISHNSFTFRIECEKNAFFDCVSRDKGVTVINLAGHSIIKVSEFGRFELEVTVSDVPMKIYVDNRSVTKLNGDE